MLMGWDKRAAGKEPTGESGEKVDIRDFPYQLV